MEENPVCVHKTTVCQCACVAWPGLSCSRNDYLHNTDHHKSLFDNLGIFFTKKKNNLDELAFSFLKCNFPMTHHVRRLVGRSVSMSVITNKNKKWHFHAHCSYQSPCFFYWRPQSIRRQNTSIQFEMDWFLCLSISRHKDQKDRFPSPLVNMHKREHFAHAQFTLNLHISTVCKI